MYEILSKDENQVKVKISVGEDEWQKYIEKAYESKKARFDIQGFRKGTAPRKIIEKNYGERVFYDDALDILFSEQYGAFLDENLDLEIIDQPSLTFEKFDSTGISFTATAPLLPKVTLGEYKNLEVEKYTEELDENRVSKQLEQDRERFARYLEAPDGEKAKLGDFATIDFTGFVDGKEFEGGKAENYRLELGSKSFIDNFEDQIVGMAKGEKKDINVKFPDDYPAENLKGKNATFKITLNKLENKNLPELNDEFASNYSDFETLDEYKASIKSQLEQSLKQKIDRENENRILNKVVEGTNYEVPDVLTQRQLDLFVSDFEQRLSYQGLGLEQYFKMTNSDLKQLRESYTEQAKKTVKTRLVLEEIIKAEKIEVSDKELDDRLNASAQKLNKSLEEYKKTLNAERLNYIKSDILFEKTLDFLTKNNKLV